MLTFLITVPRGSIQPGANQMRQQLDVQEQFRRGNAQPDGRSTPGIRRQQKRMSEKPLLRTRNHPISPAGGQNPAALQGFSASC
jgi:hypothetical protein